MSHGKVMKEEAEAKKAEKAGASDKAEKAVDKKSDAKKQKTKEAEAANGAVAKEMEKEPDLVVALHMEEDTLYGDFVTVLDGLKKSGCDKIAIQDPGT